MTEQPTPAPLRVDDTPRILGIVNITRDSFSDGGKYLEANHAIAHARRLAADGAQILDLGAASSHPDGEKVSPEEEIARLEPVIAGLRDAASSTEDANQLNPANASTSISISIDTYQPEVQRFALKQPGVAYLNDINGFAHPELYPELAAASARLIVMHSVQGFGQADRRETPADEILERTLAFFDQRVAALTEAGVARERLILDPGMGFFLGSGPDASLAILRGIPELKRRFDLPVLISVSRKSFLGALTGRETAERGAATLAAELYAARSGADYLRTHDVAALRDGLVIESALK